MSKPNPSLQAEHPRVNEDGEKQLRLLQEKFEELQKKVEAFNSFEANAKPLDRAPQTQVSQKELSKNEAPYIKWVKSISRPNSAKTPVYWDEKHRAAHERDWEYILCTAENLELIGSEIEMWTGEYGCDPLHFWKIPVNKPIWIPRLVARKLANCKYNVIRSEEQTITGSDGRATYTGSLVVTHTTNRLNAHPLGSAF